MFVSLLQNKAINVLYYFVLLCFVVCFLLFLILSCSENIYMNLLYSLSYFHLFKFIQIKLIFSFIKISMASSYFHKSITIHLSICIQGMISGIITSVYKVYSDYNFKHFVTLICCYALFELFITTCVHAFYKNNRVFSLRKQETGSKYIHI